MTSNITAILLKFDEESFFKFERQISTYSDWSNKISGGTSMGKSTFWYTKLKLSGDHL